MGKVSFSTAKLRGITGKARFPSKIAKANLSLGKIQRENLSLGKIQQRGRLLTRKTEQPFLKSSQSKAQPKAKGTQSKHTHIKAKKKGHALYCSLIAPPPRNITHNH